MFERLLNKDLIPNDKDINTFIGEKTSKLLESFEEFLEAKYKIIKDLKFPFGNDYGWGYKYATKSKHICYAFFEKEAFTITTQIPAVSMEKFKEQYKQLSVKAKQIWENRYPCGKGGGWIHFRILDGNDLNDIMIFINIRMNRK